MGPPPVDAEEVLDFLEVPAAPEPVAPDEVHSGPGPQAAQDGPGPEPFGQAVPVLEDFSGASELLDDSVSDDRMKAEVDQLTSIVYQIETLAYLKPRLARIRREGCSLSDLTALYRLVSQALLDQMLKQAETVANIRADCQKRLRQEQEALLFQASAELVNSALGKKAPDSHPEAPPPPPGEETVPVAVMRRQLAIKDEMLLEAQERHEKLLRDVKNIRNRQEKELDLQLHRAREALFRKFLPALDSFDGALNGPAGLSDLEAVVCGLHAIHRQVLDACESEGLKPVEALGQPFDPNVHEAMGHVDSEEVPDDHVFDEIRRGYLLGDKLLRAAMVRLSRNPQAKAPVAEPLTEAPVEAAAEPLTEAPVEAAAEPVAEAPEEAGAEPVTEAPAAGVDGQGPTGKPLD